MIPILQTIDNFKERGTLYGEKYEDHHTHMFLLNMSFQIHGHWYGGRCYNNLHSSEKAFY